MCVNSNAFLGFFFFAFRGSLRTSDLVLRNFYSIRPRYRKFVYLFLQFTGRSGSRSPLLRLPTLLLRSSNCRNIRFHILNLGVPDRSPRPGSQDCFDGELTDPETNPLLNNTVVFALSANGKLLYYIINLPEW